MRRAAATTAGGIRRRLDDLATIAATAPLVGLLGTCIGIASAFGRGISGEKWASYAAITKLIAESLVPTALSLLIAIPAYCVYQYFNNRAELLEVEMKNGSSELLDCLTRWPALR